jgi:hypothetical protein
MCKCCRCTRYIWPYCTDAGDADGHAVGVRAVGARALFIHAVGKPSAGAHAVGVRVLGLRTLSCTCHSVHVDGVLAVLQVPILYLNVSQDAMLQVYMLYAALL